MPKHGATDIALRSRKPEGSLGRTAQDGHLDSHTAPELCLCSGVRVLCVLTWGHRPSQPSQLLSAGRFFSWRVLDLALIQYTVHAGVSVSVTSVKPFVRL